LRDFRLAKRNIAAALPPPNIIGRISANHLVFQPSTCPTSYVRVSGSEACFWARHVVQADHTYACVSSDRSDDPPACIPTATSKGGPLVCFLACVRAGSVRYMIGEMISFKGLSKTRAANVTVPQNARYF